jgi:DNA-binding GntR family transcriptional regulator
MVIRNKTEISLPGQARERILEMLESGELQPGDPISVRMLAGRLEMSTLSVSSALHGLENDGLVVSRNRSGSNVVVISPQDIWNMVQYRVALEQRGARIACQLATEAELEELKVLAARADGAGTTDEQEWLEADDRFHQALQSCSHTPSLLFPPHYLRVFRLKLELCSGLKLFPDFKPDGSLIVAQGHRLIADLAMTRDMEQLSSLVEIHICNAIGLPELTSLRERHWEKLHEITDFLDRNKRKSRVRIFK